MKSVIIYCIFFIVSLHVLSQPTVGLLQNEEGNRDGYVLFSPVAYYDTYLIDKCGRLINKWNSNYNPGLSVYLLPDGSIIRAGQYFTGTLPPFWGGGAGGILEKHDWNNNLIWSCVVSDSMYIQHHDAYPMPNGNILVLIWEKKIKEECIEEGIDSSKAPTAMFNEKIIEIQPAGEDSAIIVWEWQVWDHLVQEFDPEKNNFGIVSEHPELVDINFRNNPNMSVADWLHINSVAYNPSLDQLILTVHALSEIWVIDHSTTIQQAASHSGGNSGKGGDLLYRWGNPQTYNRGTSSDKKLFAPHNAYWIEDGYPGEKNILIFNNGLDRPEGEYSSIELIDPPVDINGNYPILSGEPYQPVSSSWTYTANPSTDFYSLFLSGMQRLQNGNTLICAGPQGVFFEIDENNNTVWKYANPVSTDGPVNQGIIPNSPSVFRCTHYDQDYSAFLGKDMTPGNPIEFNPLPINCDSINNVFNVKSPELQYKVFPNPFDKQVLLISQTDNENIIIELSDPAGRLIYSETVNRIVKNTSHTINFHSEIKEGIYFLSIKNENTISIMKLIKI